ncbi:MAG: peptidase M75 [Prevotellaceae bacterium]|jgi:hypothetical protein|nr:peptidase M75 [Prevotellaceae bacterium]
MKKLDRFFKTALCAGMAAMILLSVSCSKNSNDDDDAEREQTLRAIVEQYVDATVVATYKSLADESVALYNALVALKGAGKTDANVLAAANKWKSARDYWEKSEAFLFGPAGDFGIDPHIDTWPLAKDELDVVLANDASLASMAGDEGDVWVSEYLGRSVLGFHGIEYVLFAGGNPKQATQITDREVTYAIAVAGDLRNKCFQLEASWAGIDNVSAAKKTKLEELELQTTLTGGYSYGEDMLNAGKAGSTQKMVVNACETIVEGCITIADEVGAMKIGKPYNGDDVNYIESPYSYNSKVDFIGNIISIQNVYLGGANAANRKASLSDYIKSVNPNLDAQVRAAIDNAIAKIEAIPYPFALNYTNAKAGEAVDACVALNDVLALVKNALNQ